MHFSKTASFLSLAVSVLAQGDLGALLRSQSDLSSLLELVSLTNLNSTLSSARNITIFAPTNAAFQALDSRSPEAQAAAARDVAAITALLQNHVVQGVYPASAAQDVPTFVRTLLTPSTNGTSYTGIRNGSYDGIVKNGNGVNIISGGLSVANVTQADIRLGDGIIIHKIDRILQFGSSFLEFTARAGYTAINAAITAAQVDLPLGAPPASSSSSSQNASGYTIFIPNNAAFQNIASVLSSANVSTLQSVLSYHIISDSVIFSPQLGNITAPSLLSNANLTFTVANDGSAWVNNAKIIQPNIIFYNGVAHVIDSVLNPLTPFNRSSGLTPSAPAASRVAFAGASSASSLPFSTISFSQASSYTTTAAILTSAPAVATSQAASNAAAASSSTSRSSTGAAAPTNGVSGLLKTGAAVMAAGGLFAVGL